MIKFIQDMISFAVEKYNERKDSEEKRNIAKVFNDRYTYRKEYIKDMPRLTGTAICSLPPSSGYAWMCPECNKIHHPFESSVFSGLQYPECCSTPKYHRLDYNIRYR